MYKTHANSARNALTPLCHLSDAVFKDLQTNFPEIFRAHSGIHRPCFTLHEFTKNRRKVEPPQHMPDTALTSVPKNFFRLLSPSNLRAAAPTIGPNKACAHAHRCIAQFEPRMGRRVVATGGARRREASRAQPVVSIKEGFPPRQGRRNHANAPKKSPKTRTAPTHARHAICNRPKRSDSPYVTFNLQPSALGPKRLAVWRWTTNPAAKLAFSRDPQAPAKHHSQPHISDLHRG